MLYLIATPIGNIEDISFRALEVLKKTEILFCEDTRVAKKLLSLLSKRFKVKFNIKEFYSLHSHNEDKVLKNININIFNMSVSFLSDAGMPCISDPGAKLVEFAQNNNIKYEVLPGSNAAITAYASSGWSEKEFLFFGFLSHSEQKRKIELNRVLNSGYNTILYEAPHRIKKLIDLIALTDPKRELFIQKEISKLYQKWYKGEASELSCILEQENLKGEWVVIIKAKQTNTSNITQEEILSLEIPKKQKAKLLSKLTGRNTKEIYNELMARG